MRTSASSHAIYQQEAAAQLALVEELILELELSPGNKETLNRLFRIFHTIKGSGSMFGFEAVASLTHKIETLLEAVRQERRVFDRELADLTLAAKDCISALLADPKLTAPPEIEARLQALGSTTTKAAPASVHQAAPGTPAQPAETAASTRYDIEVRLAPDVFTRGLNPLGILAELASLGECTVTPLFDELPEFEQLNPEECHLAWRIGLRSSCDLNAIKDCFIFVEDDSRIHIRQVPAREAAEACLPSPSQAPAAAPESLSASNSKSTSKTFPTLASAPTSKPVHTPAAEPGRGREASPADSAVRVPAQKLDQLLSIVGELVINHSRLQQIGRRQESAELTTTVEDLERLVDALRDHVLGIRMTPIGGTFGRFRRLVRDLSAELGREINFETEGEETELDKSVLDRLGEPLVHVIRNAVGHGISRPDERLREGKPRAGTIRLKATHQGSQVMIRVEDDGRGLDTEAIHKRALEQGLLKADDKPSIGELHQLVFLPGFSTAREVTSVSGRGVGMDVVKRQLEALRGTASLSSQPGQGTTVTLTLPLTLAIIEGLLVGLGNERYILPLSCVDETLDIGAGDSATGNGRNLLALREELLPFLRLRQLFSTGGTAPDIERVVVVRAHNQRFGLVVDRVFGTHQTVVQSLGRFYRGASHVSGATILGDGQVALILDVGGLSGQLNAAAARPPRAP